MKFHIPLRLSSSILHLSHEIERTCQFLYPLLSKTLKDKLKKNEKIQTIESFLSMEDNILSTTRVKNILLGKRKAYSAQEIIEVKNVSRICRQFNHWDPLSLKDFKEAHSMLLDPDDKDKGRWRQYQVVVVEGKKVTHVPPFPDKISTLMKNLFLDLKRNIDLSWIIKSCICHYGIQYIHPFTDGNGRMGRIWQHLLLLKMSPIFHYILVGNVIKNNATAYYRSLDKSDLNKNGAFFIEFCLIKIRNDLKKFENLIK